MNEAKLNRGLNVRSLTIYLLPLLLAVWACGGEAVTPTAIPTETPVATPTLAAQLIPTEIPTDTPQPLAAPPTRSQEVTPTGRPESPTGPVALACPISGDNLLINPSFEPPFNQIGQKEINVANGWQPWFVQAGENFPPEYKPADPRFTNRVLDGSSAQVYFKSFGRFIAGVRQTVIGLEPGARYQFSVYGHGWSCEEFNMCSDGSSYNPANMNMRVGIDPQAGSDGRASSIVYSEFRSVLDTYEIFCIDVVATGDKLTVFTYAAPDGPRQNQDIYWDKAALIRAP
ncbi:MAG: hypothetical protein KDE28_03070 [Anaerolineales bacterium]|nr:hypothetical protein [Anaerolineales bacterium]MCB0026860.1 hypothetical protein [Anaerolineales bacterium]